MAAIKRILLEKRKFDREYPQPFIREVKKGDTIEFEAVEDIFIVIISNKDDFLKTTTGGDPGESLEITLDPSGTFKQQYKITSETLDAPHKYYNVYLDGIYADRPGNSPPKIIIVD